MTTVVIDPGHGGTTEVGDSSPNNATGPAGTLEKNWTLDIGMRTYQALLTAGHRVLLTRDRDVNLGLRARANVAATSRAEAFVSIHFNGWSTPTVQGTETFVHRAASADSRLLARSVQQRVLASTGYRDRGVKDDALGVLNPAYHYANTAACLVEISFLTDPAEETRLGQEPYRDRVAAAIKQGIQDYIDLSSGQPLGAVEVAVPRVEHSALSLAAGACQDAAVELLLAAGGHVAHDGASLLENALVAAAANGHLAAVRRLLAEGALAHARNSEGLTAVMLAARGGHVEVVRALLDAGARAGSTVPAEETDG